ncbi:MAG: hypothetical protein AAGD92_16015 [Pseudomonadota bacterium]
MTNDNQTFGDFWPNRERQFADRSLMRTVEGLKDQGVPYETIVHALFDYTLVEATGSETRDADETLTFMRYLAMFKERIDSLHSDMAEALEDGARRAVLKKDN